MPAPRKYGQETRDRAVRMYQERRRDYPNESALQARKRVGELLDINQQTLRGWIERLEIDAGERPGAKSFESDPLAQARRRIKELEAELEMTKAASALFEEGQVHPKGSSALSGD